MGRRRAWAAVAGCLVAVALVPAARPADGRLATGSDDPVLDSGTCPDGAPEDAECGVLVVPERRGGDSDRTVRLPYVVIPAAEPDPAVPPLVYLNGGPGSETVQLAGYFGSLEVAGARDVVLLEQRGSVRSEPSLDCPAAEAALADVFAHTDPVEEEAAPVADAMAACLDEFVAGGGDPLGYTLHEAAADVRDLRIALGYDRWTLYGVSWSTLVMRATAALDRDGVDAVVLDSPVSTTTDLVESTDIGLHDALASLSDRADGEYPDPYGDLLAAAERLDADPYEVDDANPIDGDPLTYRLTGDDLATLVHGAAYDVELLPVLPYLLDRFAAGELTSLRALIPVGVDDLTSHNLGQYWVTQCQDEVPYRTRSATSSRPVNVPLAVDEAVCARLDLPVAPAGRARPAWPTQPTLVLSGVEDPVTPASIAHADAGGRPETQVLEFAGVGHAVLFSSRCARSTVAAWVADPTIDAGAVCDRGTPAYDVLRSGDVAAAPALAPMLLDAEDGDWWPLVVPVLWALLCVGWTLWWLGSVGVRLARRRIDRSAWVDGVAPLTGLLLLVAVWLLVSDAVSAQPMLLLAGLPAALPWLGLLLLPGVALTGWEAWRRRGRARLWPAVAGAVWVGCAGWLGYLLLA